MVTQEPASITHHDKNQHIARRAELHPMAGQHQYAYAGIERGAGVQTANTDTFTYHAMGLTGSLTARKRHSQGATTRLHQGAIIPFKRKGVPHWAPTDSTTRLVNSHPTPQTQSSSRSINQISWAEPDLF